MVEPDNTQQKSISLLRKQCLVQAIKSELLRLEHNILLDGYDPDNELFVCAFDKIKYAVNEYFPTE